MPERAGHGTRDPTDYYATTPALAKLICETLRKDIKEPRFILEPGCGAGSFMEAIRSVWPAAALHGVEIHQDLASYAQDHGFDVELADLLRSTLDKYDLVIGNPPFRYADELVPILLRRLEPGGVLALVLRLNYLAGQERYGRLWRESPPARIYALPARPGFTPDGKTDATDYCVVAWVEGYIGSPIFGWIDNRSVANKWENPQSFPDPRREPRTIRYPQVALLEEYERASQP